MARIAAMHAGGAALAVTHVAIIRCLFLYCNSLLLDSYKSVPVPNLSVFSMSGGPGGVLERIL